jgi:hypothetical protein
MQYTANAFYGSNIYSITITKSIFRESHIFKPVKTRVEGTENLDTISIQAPADQNPYCQTEKLEIKFSP